MSPSAPKNDPDGAPPHGMSGPLAVSLVLAMVISAPMSLSALRGGAPATLAVVAFLGALAVVWILGALGSWALQLLEGSPPRPPGTATPAASPDSRSTTNR